MLRLQDLLFQKQTSYAPQAHHRAQPEGRAAQMGILALMVHEQLGISPIPNLVLDLDFAFCKGNSTRIEATI
jgi:hypothetical protein